MIEIIVMLIFGAVAVFYIAYSMQTEADDNIARKAMTQQEAEAELRKQRDEIEHRERMRQPGGMGV